MTTLPNTELGELLTNHPATSEVVHAVLGVWPEHERYIRKSLAVRSTDCRDTTELLAKAALVLGEGRLSTIATNYRWTCDRLHEEELHFHRTGRYRLDTFEEAYKEVYSDSVYMERYNDGLLFSQVLWANHAESCHFYFRTVPKHIARGARLLEIGPGHGLMLYLALRDFGLVRATAWDLSPVSIRHTQTAVEKLGFANVEFAVRDLSSVRAGEDSFDLVVLSEVLEHLKDPITAMRHVRGLVQDTGRVFVNVPINSPSPDHIYLMETLDDARRLLTETGFRVIDEGAFATQGAALDRALRNKVSVSVCLIGAPV